MVRVEATPGVKRPSMGPRSHWTAASPVGWVHHSSSTRHVWNSGPAPRRIVCLSSRYDDASRPATKGPSALEALRTGKVAQRMFLDSQGLTVEGLGTAFAFFLVFLLLIRIATRETKRLPRLLFFGAAWLTLTLLAARRVVVTGQGGGADAWGYRDNFLSPQGAAGQPLSSTGARGATEPLHLALMRVVRIFTDDEHTYFFVVHGIIMFGVVYFIAKAWTRDYPVLPLLLFFPSYLASLSAMRNWMAIAMLLIALTFYMKKRTKMFYLWALVAVGFHYSAVVFLALPLVLAFIARRRTTAGAVAIVLAMNAVGYASGDIMGRLLAGGRYEQYLSWEEASFFFVAPMLAIVLAGVVFARGSEVIRPESQGVVAFMIFIAGLTTIIIFYGGFRYLSYSIVPQAAVAAMVLFAVRSNAARNPLAQVGMPIAVYATLLVEANVVLQTVINMSQVFPLTWR